MAPARTEVPGSHAAEWVLRRYAEDAIVSGAGFDQLAQRARALVFVDLLDAGLAAAVLDIYGRAELLRNRELLWQGTTRHQPAAPPRERRVHASSTPVETAHGTFTSDYVVLTATTVEVAGELVFGGRSSAPAIRHGRPPQLSITVGSGPAVNSHFSGVGSHRSWHGRFVAQGRFDTAATVIEIEGQRLELADAVTPDRIVVADIDPQTPLAELAAYYVRHLLAVSEDEDSLNIGLAATTLLECGALSSDDPVLDEVSLALDHRAEAVPAAVPHHRHGRRRSRSVVVDARTPEFGGVVVAVSRLLIQPDGIDIAVSAWGAPGTGDSSHSLDAPQLSFALIDDHGGRRRGRLHRSSSGDDYLDGVVRVDGLLPDEAHAVQIEIGTERGWATIDLPLPAGVEE
jgi:hypothetical protein